MTSSNDSKRNNLSLEGVIQTRRNIRKEINSNETLDKILHYYTALVVSLNIILILYAMVSITARMLLLGVPLIDSIPLAFYILPLIVFLPKLLFDYLKTRSGLFTMIILCIVATIFGMIVPLIRGFSILVVLNILAIVIVFMLGRFRPTSPVRSIGRRGVAWIIILNSLGLMLPVSVYLMGEIPIASVVKDETSIIYLEMPLGDFEYPYVNITPDSSLLQELEDVGFGVDLRLNAYDNESIGLLREWLLTLSSENIPFRLTSSGNKDNLLASNPDLLGSTSLLMIHYGYHWSTLLETISLFDNLSLSTENLRFSFDMTLSKTEWNMLMNQTRSVNLQGFSTLVRSSLDAIDSTQFPNMVLALSELVKANNINSSMVVDGFVLDDLIDNDVSIMEVCGISPDVIGILDSSLEVLSDRTQYAEAMAGDVGEYLVYTYSLTPFANSIRVGIAGTDVGAVPIRLPVYTTVEELAKDIVIASGNGVDEIIVRSLPSIISSFGASGISLLTDAIHSLEIADVTYTFRIFAFRAVIMAIDSFDFLMF